jgi:2-haloacid dehalogenase
MFDAALAAAGAPGRSHVLMVGDSLTSDIRGGAEYGIDTCWFNPERQLIGPGDPAPTYEIPALDGLRDILDRGDGSSGETQPATSPRDAAAR